MLPLHVLWLDLGLQLREAGRGNNPRPSTCHPERAADLPGVKGPNRAKRNPKPSPSPAISWAFVFGVSDHPITRSPDHPIHKGVRPPGVTSTLKDLSKTSPEM